MKKYMVFGFTNIETFDPSEEPSQKERQVIMDQWMKWKDEMGDLLLDMGSPLINGYRVYKDGVQGKAESHLSGYMTIYAESVEHAIELLNASPLFGQGHGQKYELFERIM